MLKFAKTITNYRRIEDMLSMVVKNTKKKVKKKKFITGLFFPDNIYRSVNFYFFLQLNSFRLWFRLVSSIVRSGELLLPLSQQIYEEYYIKRGLLVTYYPVKALASRLGVNRTNISRMKKELVDGGFIKTEIFNWKGKEYEVFIMGEHENSEETLYALDVCVRGYRSTKQDYFYYWPEHVVRSRTFIDFMRKPCFVLWFFLTANIIRGKFIHELPNLIRKEYYDIRNLLPAYYPDKIIMETLGVSRSTVKKMRKALVEEGAIKVEHFWYKKHLRPVCLLGRRYIREGKLVEAVEVFEQIKCIENPISFQIPKEASLQYYENYLRSPVRLQSNAKT
jgi:DNA-binding Lrp family transcriptional regulator